jgi:MFS family permease
VPAFLRSFRSRNYRLFFGGQAGSLIGMWLQLTAMSWLMYRLTQAATWVAFLTFAWQGPGLVLGPIAGALADRVDRRRILIVAQALSVLPAAALGIFTIAGWITPWQVVVFAFVTGVLRSFEIPTRQAFIPDIVAAEDLANAIGMNSALFNAARLVGPAIAGALIPFVGEGWCFIANAVSYLAILAALVAMTLPHTTGRRAVTSSMLADILEGFAHVRRDPAVRAILGGLAFFAVVGMPYSVLLPSFASRQLGGGPHTFSSLQAAVGFGAMVAAFAVAVRSRVAGLERWLVVAGASFGALLFALSRATSLPVALTLLIPLGGCFIVTMATTNTLLQTLAPGHLRGRVMSIHTTLFLGVFPLSGLVWGWLADRLGEAMVLAGGGVLVVLGALVFGRGVLRHAPPAVALAAARGPTSAREARDEAAPAMPAVPSVAAIDVVPPESAAVGRN